jgi:hypothetical protein
MRPSLSRHSFGFRRYLLTFLLLSGGGWAWGAVLRVSPEATGEPVDGITWNTAFRSITNALAAAQAGDELWVGAGTYPGGLVVPDRVALYGGFAGTEAFRSEREPKRHVTRIDGGGQTLGFTFASGAGSETRVDGFTVENGSSTLGGAFRVQSSSPVIANNVMMGNTASRHGGALYLDNSTATITNNYILYNGTDGTLAGGGLMATNSSPTLVGNTFSGNRAREGGGLFFVFTAGVIEHNYLIANVATRDGGGVLLSAASPRLVYNRLIGNESRRFGGGLLVTGGGAPVVFNNVLARNTASGSATEPAGGGLQVDLISQPSVVNNTLVGNVGPVGGIYCLNPNATLANNVVAFGSSGVGGAPTLRLFNNNIFGNGQSNYVATADPGTSQGNQSADPLFGGDTALGDVRLLPDSPSRDAGDSQAIPSGFLVDLDGDARIIGAAVDIGADESDGVSTRFLPPIVRVAPDGNDLLDGSDWGTAMRTVQGALERAARTGGEVWVRAGTYPGPIVVRPLTSLYGGFSGSETNRADRNWNQNATVLDGGGEGVVVTMTRLSLLESLDGFTVRNGFSTAGGGLFTDSPVVVRHNRFVGNRTLNPDSNTVPRGGAAIYVAEGASRIWNNVFVNNVADSPFGNRIAEGGAIKVQGGTPQIANNLFRYNVVTHQVSTGRARGGAVFVGSQGWPSLINNTFLQNSATMGTGVSTRDEGGALLLSGTNVLVVANNLVVYNSSGIAAPSTAPSFRHNLVFGNIRGNYEGVTDPTGTAGNLSVSPRLTGPYGDPHLVAGSPAIDAGDDTLVALDWTDLDGNDRRSGVRVDIGADEFDGSSVEVAARIFYVKPDGDDAGDGLTWATAKRTVTAAVNAANVAGGEIWVAAGAYTERVQLEVFTYLYGGFSGTETSRDQRNWAMHPTLLDGTGSAGPAVVSAFGMDGYSAVSGFIIQNGAGRQGGGVYAFGSPFITDNLIRSNVVTVASGFTGNGAGIYAEGGAPRIRNNILLGNRAVSRGSTNGLGGALYLQPSTGAIPVVANNTIIGNTATNNGAAIFVTANGAARLVNNLIAYNQSGIATAGTEVNSAIVADFNCLWDNRGADYLRVQPGTNSIHQSPQLVDVPAANLRLRADSPCRDAADTFVTSSALDIYGEPRLRGDRLDIGADEYTGPLEADFNIALTQPVTGATFVAPATVFVEADITGGTTSPAYVEFLANGRVVAVATNAPFSQFASGLLFDDYLVQARAITASGSIKVSESIAISVLLPPNNVLPTVAFTSPTNTQSIAIGDFGTINADFTFGKTGGRVIAWQVFQDGRLIGENLAVGTSQTTGTVEFGPVGIGNYMLDAVVTGNLGDKATNSVTFSFIPRSTLEVPVLSPVTWTTNGQLRLELSAPTFGALYSLEATTNYVQWGSLRTIEGGGAPLVLLLSPTNQFRAIRGRGQFP